MSSDHLQAKLTATAIAWRQHIFDWRASGLSQTEYCSRHKISIQQFWNWKSKFNKAGITKKDRSKLPAEAFVAVTVTDQDTAAGAITPTGGDSGVTVVIKKNIEIHLDCCFDTSTLVKVVKALGGI
jgi:hypothetical protein